MSEIKEKKAEEFRLWKEDLDKRCYEHLYQHFEKNIHNFPQEQTSITTTSSKFVFPSLKIEVQQSDIRKDCWRVLVNDEVAFSSWGPTAHIAAMRFADNYGVTDTGGFVGNDRSTSLGLPPPCVFCGGRFSHRTECPDFKKDGPQLPPSGSDRGEPV